MNTEYTTVSLYPVLDTDTLSSFSSDCRDEIVQLAYVYRHIALCFQSILNSYKLEIGVTVKQEGKVTENYDFDVNYIFNVNLGKENLMYRDIAKRSNLATIVKEARGHIAALIGKYMTAGITTDMYLHGNNGEKMEEGIKKLQRKATACCTKEAK